MICVAKFDRYFEIDEANSLLPKLRPLLERIRKAAKGLGNEIGREEVEALSRAARSNGGGAEASARWEGFAQLMELVKEVHEEGVLVKDLHAGLLDFPAWRDGREILLCWRADEDEIRFWHDLDSGFSGCQPI